MPGKTGTLRNEVLLPFGKKTPSCIDLGKEKYGGTFVTEEVEDVKTFLHLLLLLTSMCGISLVQYIHEIIHTHMVTRYN